jgi:hypothetical protein
MENSMFVRRLAAVASAVMLALGGMVIAATPAHASDPNCQTWVGASYQAGSYVAGYKFKECTNGTETPLYVTVERYLAPGTWQVEASGYGEATYYCQGQGFNRFRIPGWGQIDILCT